MARGDKNARKVEERKEASRRAQAKEEAAQKKLRQEQESKNPPKMSRKDVQRARRMDAGNQSSTKGAPRW